MPKDMKRSFHSTPAAPSPYTTSSSTTQRNAAIWSIADDEILVQARASGLNWQPIASRHFPSKTANACRKRHERLMERRHVEDWDAQKLDLLAQEYMMLRRAMWEVLAQRVGERWTLVEAKCMEKGLRTLQTAARTAQRRASADDGHARCSSIDGCTGIPEYNSDSGIGFGSEGEMEVDEDNSHHVHKAAIATSASHTKSSSWHAHPSMLESHDRGIEPQTTQQGPPTRSYSVPQPLPLYQPPPPVPYSRRTNNGAGVNRQNSETFLAGRQTTTSMATTTTTTRYSPDYNGRGGISIQAMLAPLQTRSN